MHIEACQVMQQQPGRSDTPTGSQRGPSEVQPCKPGYGERFLLAVRQLARIRVCRGGWQRPSPPPRHALLG